LASRPRDLLLLARVRRAIAKGNKEIFRSTSSSSSLPPFLSVLTKLSWQTLFRVRLLIKSSFYCSSASQVFFPYHLSIPAAVNKLKDMYIMFA
jgi:hypothetical protein